MALEMTGYVAGFSGLFSTGIGGTRDIAERIPGASHYASGSGYADWREVADEIKAMHERDMLPRPLCLFGHSNGGYAVLKIAQELNRHGIQVDYLGIIDLTLKPSPHVYGNVKLVQEFHSAYAKVKLNKTFRGKHEFHDLDELMDRNIGHSEAARIDFTQDKIVETILSLGKGEAPVTVPKPTDKTMFAHWTPIFMQMLIEDFNVSAEDAAAVFIAASKMQSSGFKLLSPYMMALTVAYKSPKG